MVWNVTPKQLQDPDEVIERLKKKCHGYSREMVLTALGWALAGIYQTLLSIVAAPSRRREGKHPNRHYG